MKFLFFIFTFLILSAGAISAATLGGSPSSLNFNTNIGEEQCLIFVVSSSDYFGNLNSIMKWSEKDAEVSSPNDFVLENSEVELNIQYSPQTISDFDGEEEIEVCILGDEIGTWKGSLEYRAELEGNIGMGVGTWLRVNITEKPVENSVQNPPASSSSGGSSGGGGSIISSTSSENMDNQITETSTNKTNTDESVLGELEEPERNSKITGSVIGFAKTKTGKSVFVAVLAIVIIFAGIKIYKRKY